MDINEISNIGSKIRKERRARGFSQSELSKKLENLQDKLPPFSIHQAKEIIKKDLGENTFNSIKK